MEKTRKIPKRRKTTARSTQKIPQSVNNAHLEYLSAVNYLDSIGILRVYEGSSLTLPERINLAIKAARDQI